MAAFASEGAKVAFLARSLGGAVAVALAAALIGCGPGGGVAPEATSSETQLADAHNEFRAVRPDPETLGPPAGPEAQAFFEGEFEATGAEPFWRLDLLDGYVSFTRPGLEEVAGLPSAREIRAQGALIEAGPLVIILRAGTCVHVSGETYPYLATVQFDGVAYEGCARRAEGQTGATPAWSVVLTELAPAIDACLARVQAQPARVTIAFLLDENAASVRLVDGYGGRYECNATLDGSDVSFFEPIADRDVIDGEREPLFTRAPNPPPEGRCFESQPALAPDGTELGWLTRKTC